MNATIHQLPAIPSPELTANFRGLKNCWIIELPGLILYSVNREKVIEKAKKVSCCLRQLK